MDTKLKKFSYKAAWVLLVISTVGAAVWGTATVILWEIRNWNQSGRYGYHDEMGNWVPYESPWRGVVDKAALEELVELYGFIAIGLAVAAMVMLIVVMVKTGRHDLDESGCIRLNWFDRVWTEVHVMVAVSCATAFGALTIPLFELGCRQDWFGVFEPYVIDEYYFGIPNRLVIALIVVGFVASAIVTWSCLVTIVKKMKARMFWEKSLLGGVCFALWRGVRSSDRTTIKVVAYLLILCSVEGFCGLMANRWYGTDGWWILAGVVFAGVWVGLMMPKKIREWNAIRKGASEIRRGNLGYKIPVEPGRSGRIDELGRLAADINHIGEAQSLAVQNELKNQRMKTDLISNVSHDLKTPLTSMVTYIDLLKTEGLDSPDAPEYLKILDEKTQRLKVLTENLFEAAKASSGAIPVNMEVIDMASLLNQSLGEMDEKLKEKHLEVIARNQCENAKVMADGQLLWRVMENLLSNVSKYALEGSRVYVDLYEKTEEDHGLVALEIKNISRDQLNISAEELMERFKRGDESRNTEGSGLGLAIAKDLTKLMKGGFDITVDGDLFKACVMMEKGK
ncbi:MAG: HAMP domain-containing histidine kinase [Firmicutes bacterium]|nr:HAMP domain-containing histidine kinase [Bacillota bacterium]